MQIDTNLIFLIVVVILIGSLTIYSFYWRGGNFQPTQLSQPKNTSTPIYMSETDTEPNKIILGNINNPWGEIARYQKAETDNYEEILLNEKALIGFSSWFQQAPNLVQSGTQMMLNTYTLTFKPEIAKGIADGSLKIMESLDGGIRAVAVDSNNIMRGLGSLNPAAGMQSLASVMVVWQILAVITAQKFLTDINKQLVQINKELKEIKDFLEYQQYAKLMGSLKYLQRNQNLLNSQSFENLEFGVFLNKLEDIEQECTQIMVELELAMENVHVASEKQPLDAFFNIQNNLIDFTDLITDYERLARSYLIAVSVKCLAYQTRFAIPSNHDLTLERLSDLQTELTTLDENQQKFFQLVSQRLPELKSLIDDGKDKQSQLKQGIDESKNSLTAMGQYIQKLVSETESSIRGHLQEISQPLTLLVELNEDRQIIKTWKLHNENNKTVEMLSEEIVPSEKVVEEVPHENNICPECGLPFKTPKLVQEHRKRWGH